MLTLFCVPVTVWELEADSRASGTTSATVEARHAEPIQTLVLHQTGSLNEIKDKRSMALVIDRSSVLDATGDDGTITREAMAAEPRLASRYRSAYSVIARKLNQYIRKYHSLRPADQTGQADFIVYFKVVEHRRMLNGFYPYGEMFVIVNPATSDSPRIIWRTAKIMFAGDAITELLRDLKVARGER